MKSIDLLKGIRRNKNIIKEYLISSYQYTLERVDNQEIAFMIERNKNDHETFKMPNCITKLMSYVFSFKLSERTGRSLAKVITLPQKHFTILQHLNTILRQVINSYNGRSTSTVYYDNLLNGEYLEFNFDLLRNQPLVL